MRKVLLSPYFALCAEKERDAKRSERRIKTNRNIEARKTGGYIGTVWYVDDDGQDKRKSFSVKTKAEVQQKITNYIDEFNIEIEKATKSERYSRKVCRVSLRCL